MKILIIDDEPLIHISIEKLIHNYCDNIEVFHAYNGQEMQLLLQKHDFLLAYVDIKLPGISGLEAIRCGKEISPNTIYYIMTGFDSFEFAKEAIKLKVEDYLYILLLFPKRILKFRLFPKARRECRTR